MTPAELYKLPPIKTTYDLYLLSKEMTEVDTYDINEDANKRVLTSFYADHDFDGRRGWVLFAVSFDNKPFMVCQAAGRELRDHKQSFITNLDLYYEAVKYLNSLKSPESDSHLAVCAEDEQIDSFYNAELKHFYDPNLKPKYKVGDVVKVKIWLKNWLHGTGKGPLAWLAKKVKIDCVYPMNPLHTYFGMHIDNKHGASFNDSEIVG